MIVNSKIKQKFETILGVIINLVLDFILSVSCDYELWHFLSQKLFFSHKNFKKENKEGGTNFIVWVKKHDWMIHKNLFT